ncbi:SigE family RNA polymerase sigma factor [Nakamurella sp. A5-74]|uniref:SigE family RNA polymerase sigma factor n=1 Tax=Nakamurella sp. A5-74 TaxID=3158264 RepID=A0AAU8DN81_9ACTN
MTPEEEVEFSQFVLARRGRIRRTAYLLSGDWDRADDLTQIAFVKVHGAWEKIADPSARSAYLRTCLIRANIDESRRPWRREKPTEELPDSVDRFDLAEAAVNREEMRDALRQVPTGQRTTLVLRFYEGLSVREVAQLMTCSEGTVKSQTVKGLSALRRALAAVSNHDEIGGAS